MLTVPYLSYIYEEHNFFRQFIDTVYQAGILIDSSLNIICFGKKAFPHLKTRSERSAILGTRIDLYDKQSPFEQVIKTGRPVKGFLLKNKLNKSNLSDIYPIYCGGEVIGAFCLLAIDDLNDIKKIITQIENQNELALSKEIYDKISHLESRYTFDNYIGQSEAVRKMIHICERAALTDYPILIHGETGTGKEIIAHSIHAASCPNFLVPFVRINCTAIPAPLLESELFGHEKGAFTGASTMKKGKFEIAENGTILLDEIEAMDMTLQGKLLRVLEEREFERVGGHALIPLKARIIASTNQNLYAMAAKGQFRQDLYYRLNVIEIKLPPLRERKEDIPLLIRHFIEDNHFDLQVDADVYPLLSCYAWPGNVRELRNMILKASVICANHKITRADISAMLDIGYEDRPETPASCGPESEQAHIMDALAKTRWNIKSAAALLGCSRQTLYTKMSKYGIRRKSL